jgi:hypothetical protein
MVHKAEWLKLSDLTATLVLVLNIVTAKGVVDHKAPPTISMQAACLTYTDSALECGAIKKYMPIVQLVHAVIIT